MKFFLAKIDIIFTLILVSAIFSSIFFHDQISIAEGGLVISGDVIYSDNFSPIKFYSFNTWTLLTQFSAFLLKLNLNVKIVSYILIFILTSILFLSSYLILFKLTKDKILSIFISIFLIFFQKNLGDTNYPSLIFTNHTFGAYAQAFIGLIIATMLYNNWRISIFLSCLLISIHPLVGIWVTTVILFVIFFYKIPQNLKFFILKILPGIIIILLSLIFFFYFSIEKVNYDHNLFNIYMEKWDGHRAPVTQIHTEYILKSLIFLLTINVCLRSEKFKLFLFFLNVLILSSFVIYVVFSFFDLNNLGLFSTIISGRFMTTYTFIAYPIILSSIFEKINNKFLLKKILYLLFITYSIMHYKNFYDIKDNLLNSDLINYKIKNQVFHELSKINDANNIIATENSAFNVLYLSKKPVLITRNFDFLPYHPYLINKVRDILAEVYGYDFNSPIKQHRPFLNDKFIRNNFESRTSNDWIKIKNKFNSNYVIVPKGWSLNLEKYFEDNEYTLFKIN